MQIELEWGGCFPPFPIPTFFFVYLDHCTYWRIRQEAQDFFSIFTSAISSCKHACTLICTTDMCERLVLSHVQGYIHPYVCVLDIVLAPHSPFIIVQDYIDR